jgi:hypothetical protein
VARLLGCEQNWPPTEAPSPAGAATLMASHPATGAALEALLNR